MPMATRLQMLSSVATAAMVTGYDQYLHGAGCVEIASIGDADGDRGTPADIAATAAAIVTGYE